MPETVYSVARQYHKSKQTLPVLLVKLYLYQLARALAHIHALGICHRDIKPQNLLLDPQVSVSHALCALCVRDVKWLADGVLVHARPTVRCSSSRRTFWRTDTPQVQKHNHAWDDFVGAGTASGAAPIERGAVLERMMLPSSIVFSSTRTMLPRNNLPAPRRLSRVLRIWPTNIVYLVSGGHDLVNSSGFGRGVSLVCMAVGGWWWWLCYCFCGTVGYLGPL